MNPFSAINILATPFFLVWIAFALSNAINPRFMWKITDSWKATKEPLDSYFLIRRVGGAVFSIIGIAFFLFVSTRG